MVNGCSDAVFRGLSLLCILLRLPLKNIEPYLPASSVNYIQLFQ